MVSQNAGLLLGAVAIGGILLASRNKQVPGDPLLSVSPSAVDFGVISEGDAPLAILVVGNQGGGTLEWTATSLATWVTVSPTAGSGPGPVSLSVDPNLAPGQYVGSVEFDSNGGMVSVPIQAEVGTSGPVVTSVTVIPDNATIEVGQGQLYAATAHFDDGGALNVTAQASWSTPDPGIAVVTGNLATGVNPGTATIEASFGGFTGAVTLTVTAPPSAVVTGLTIQPAAATIGDGETVTYTAIAGFDDGTVQDVSLSASFSLQIISGNPVASISGNVVTGLSSGSAVVEVAFGGFTAQAALTVDVIPPGPTVTAMRVEPTSVTIEVDGAFALQAIASMSDGSEVNVTTMAGTLWGSSDPSIVTVRQDGIIEAVAEGQTFVNASLGGFAGVATVTVAAPPTLQSVKVTPDPFDMAAGQTIQFSVTAFFDDGSQSDVTDQVAWTSSGPLSNNGGGSFTALSVQNNSPAAVGATFEGIFNQANGTVQGTGGL